MKTYWSIVAIALVMSVVNIGCVGLEKYQALERANSVLEEDLSRAKQDLLDCQHMNRQKDTMLESLNNQIATKDQMINSLTDENKSLRTALARAQDILEKQTRIGDVTIVKPALPEPLHKELKALADAYPDEIEYLPNKGAVRWKADLLFPLGSDQVSGSTETLKKFAEIVSSEAATGFDVIIIGHTCTTPIKRPETLAEHKTNWHLSAHRSISIMQLLAGEGLSEGRMGVMGYGEHRPIADNKTKDGKAKNRRVEIYLVTKDSVRSVSNAVYQVQNMGLVFVHPHETKSPG
ncbi:MAG: OmpA family protein [Planctomycetota bacterium]|nr:MAG: OmpA family protein [Planctomycetota bacterium]